MRKQYRRKRTYQRATVPILIIVAIAALIFSWAENRSSAPVSSTADGLMYVHYIDIGQGDSELITLPSGKNILIDAGPGSSADDLCGYLKENAIETIDLMVLTHPHEDHIGGAAAAISLCEVKEVLMPDAQSTTSVFEKTLDAIEKENCKCTLAQADMTLSVGEAEICVLGPVYPEEYDLNNASVVLTVTYGKTRFMFTGDAETPSENDILNKFTESELKSDVLKVGHHGSRTSTGSKFLHAVSPEYAVISCEQGNDYGHPHKETLEALKTLGINISRTDKEGTVIFSSDGNSVSKTEN